MQCGALYSFDQRFHGSCCRESDDNPAVTYRFPALPSIVACVYLQHKNCMMESLVIIAYADV